MLISRPLTLSPYSPSPRHPEGSLHGQVKPPSPGSLGTRAAAARPGGEARRNGSVLLPGEARPRRDRRTLSTPSCAAALPAEEAAPAGDSGGLRAEAVLVAEESRGCPREGACPAGAGREVPEPSLAQHFWQQLPLTACPCPCCLIVSLLGDGSVSPRLLPVHAHRPIPEDRKSVV